MANRHESVRFLDLHIPTEPLYKVYMNVYVNT